MATIREYYDSACSLMSIGHTWQLHGPDGSVACDVEAKIAYAFKANAKYWYFFVPEYSDIEGAIFSLLVNENTKKCQMSPEGDGAHIWFGGPLENDPFFNGDLRFTGRVYVFIDAVVPSELQGKLRQVAKQNGLQLTLRDREWAKKQSEGEVPLAFISHDFRDKERIVRPLVQCLSKNPSFPIWYDEYSLNVGDSLRKSIERGLREAKKCVLILSPNFLTNEGWGLAEFDSIFTRELVEKKNVILPVWCDVSKQDVYEYSPRLADKVALSWNLGPDEVARRLINSIGSDSAE